MARAKWFSKDELDIIRLGVKAGHGNQRIADYLGRTRQGVAKQINRMREEGTLENYPFDFMGKGQDDGE